MYERSKQQSYDLFTSPLFWTVAAGSGLIAFAAWNLYKKRGMSGGGGSSVRSAAGNVADVYRGSQQDEKTDETLQVVIEEEKERKSQIAERSITTVSEKINKLVRKLHESGVLLDMCTQLGHMRENYSIFDIPQISACDIQGFIKFLNSLTCFKAYYLLLIIQDRSWYGIGNLGFVYIMQYLLAQLHQAEITGLKQLYSNQADVADYMIAQLTYIDLASFIARVDHEQGFLTNTGKQIINTIAHHVAYMRGFPRAVPDDDIVQQRIQYIKMLRALWDTVVAWPGVKENKKVRAVFSGLISQLFSDKILDLDALKKQFAPYAFAIDFTKNYGVRFYGKNNTAIFFEGIIAWIECGVAWDYIQKLYTDIYTAIDDRLQIFTPEDQFEYFSFTIQVMERQGIFLPNDPKEGEASQEIGVIQNERQIKINAVLKRLDRSILDSMMKDVKKLDKEVLEESYSNNLGWVIDWYIKTFGQPPEGTEAL